jgi:hypothetical protein
MPNVTSGKLILGIATHTTWQHCRTYDYSSFADELYSLNNSDRFPEFKRQETSLHLFSALFNIEVDNVPEKFQMELIDFSLLDFNKLLYKDEFPQLVEFTTKEFLCLVAPTSVNNYFPE